jgi:RNA polymerase sigma-54 factor
VNRYAPDERIHVQLKQQLKLSQNLVMTPQLQQAIKLLQLGRQELLDFVQEELLENPVLEDVLALPNMSREEVTSATNATSENASPAASEGQAAEIDWERYLEHQAQQAPLPSAQRGGDDELPNYEARATRAEDLAEHLTWQIRMSDLLDEERAFALLVVGNLDDAGYLRLDGLAEDEIVPKLAAEAGLDPEDAEEVLKIIQRMDPIGAGARNLRECLLVQAEHFDLDPLARTVLSNHLGHLEKRNYQAVAKALKISVEEVYDVAQVIAELEPRPGRNFISEEPRYITPDVEVIKVGDDYFVRTDDDGMPRLKISNFYRSAMRGDPKAKDYIQSKMRSAQWLIRSIDQRRKTIVRVTECIVEKQREFFEKGIDYLKPMILRDVAETVQLHESTISRVTSNKYVNTPQGLFELKFFFNAAIRREHDDDIASESVKQAIKKMVGEEDARAPYSDQKIVELLAKQDTLIARRTVAKYRQRQGIQAAAQRRKRF